MKRGNADLNVKAKSGVVELAASMAGSVATFRLPPELARQVAMMIMVEAEKADAQIIEHQS